MAEEKGIGGKILDYLKEKTKGGFLYPGLRPEEQKQIDELETKPSTTEEPDDGKQKQQSVIDQYESRRS